MGCGSSTATPAASPVSTNPRFIDISGQVRSGQDHFQESIIADQEVILSSKFSETKIATDVKGDGW
jgi:hypothetical protein